MKWANFKKVLEFWIKACIREDFFFYQKCSISSWVCTADCSEAGAGWLGELSLCADRDWYNLGFYWFARNISAVPSQLSFIYSRPMPKNIEIFLVFLLFFLPYTVIARDVSECTVHQNESRQAALSTDLHKTCSLLLYKMWKLIFDYCRTGAEIKRDFSLSSSQWATICPKMVLLFQPHYWVEIGRRDYCMR